MLRDYIDRLRDEWSNHKKIRERTIDPNNFNENEVSAPLLAPSWARAGYEGRLKKAVNKACKLSDNQENQHQQPEQPERSDSNNDLADDQPELSDSNNELTDDVLSVLSRTYNEEEVEEEEREMEEEVEEEVEEVMLTSSDNRPINQHSDDDLEMDG